jgi:hypothetical protein
MSAKKYYRNDFRSLPRSLFSVEEIEFMKRKIDNFYSTHPVGEIPRTIDFDIDNEKTRKIEKKIRWYYGMVIYSNLIDEIIKYGEPFFLEKRTRY